MRKARGYLITSDPEITRAHEVDTFTCLHCQKVIDKPPYKQPTDDVLVNGRPQLLGGYCHKCDGPICPDCIGKPCVPIEKWLEIVEKRSERKRHYDELLKRK